MVFRIDCCCLGRLENPAGFFFDVVIVGGAGNRKSMVCVESGFYGSGDAWGIGNFGSNDDIAFKSNGRRYRRRRWIVFSCQCVLSGYLGFGDFVFGKFGNQLWLGRDFDVTKGYEPYDSVFGMCVAGWIMDFVEISSTVGRR